MAKRKKKALGRGMSKLVDGSLSSIVASAGESARHEPAATTPPQPEPHAGPPRPRPADGPSAESNAPVSSVSKDPGDRPYGVVSVASGKGGTGKSVLVSNLGVLLSSEARVTILDADLGLANIHILYNLMPRYSAAHVITGERLLEDVILEGPRGVRLIPGGSGIPELATLSEIGFGSFAEGMGQLDATTDLLLIDAPGGIDRQALTFLLASDQVLVVTTDDITAMTDAYAVVKTVLTRRPGSSVVMIVNLARSYAEGLETFQKMAHVARKFLGRELALGGIIPFDEEVEASVAARVPVTLSHPESPAARAIASIAGRIVAFRDRAKPSGRPFATRLKGLIGATAAGA